MRMTEYNKEIIGYYKIFLRGYEAALVVEGTD